MINHKQSIAGGIIAFVIATSCCWLPVLAIALGGAAGFAGLEQFSGPFIMIGLALLGFGIYQLMHKKQSSMNVKLYSIITCPQCGYSKEEKMPTNACQYFYECEQCHQLLKPKEGDCCVYCSYGTVPCPPIQKNEACC